MMAATAALLQKSLHRTLGVDTRLTEALGGTRIHGAAPASAVFPHMTFGCTGVYDWSKGAESELLFTLHVWSKAGGDGEAEEIMKDVSERLDGRSVALDDDTVMRLHLEFAEIRYDESLALRHGMLRFRALASPPDPENEASPGDIVPTA